MTTEIPDSMKNVKYFLVFECVWLEDEYYPEYKFVSKWTKIQDAEKALVQLDLDKKNPFTNYNKIFMLECNKTPTFASRDKLEWNEKYQCWANPGCFATVTLAQLLD
jgi:hypothetical protein